MAEMEEGKIRPASEALKEQKCSACGGTLRFDPGKGKLVCEYCASEFDLEQEGKEGGGEGSIRTEGFDFMKLNDQALRPDAQALPVYNCVSCGAEVIAAPEQIALTCPYCRNNIVMTDRISGQLRPDSLIPFRITSKELPAAVQKFYKGKVLLPRRFFSDSTMGNITGPSRSRAAARPRNRPPRRLPTCSPKSASTANRS